MQNALRKTVESEKAPKTKTDELLQSLRGKVNRFSNNPTLAKLERKEQLADELEGQAARLELAKVLLGLEVERLMGLLGVRERELAEQAGRLRGLDLDRRNQVELLDAALQRKEEQHSLLSRDLKQSQEKLAELEEKERRLQADVEEQAQKVASLQKLNEELVRKEAEWVEEKSRRDKEGGQALEQLSAKFAETNKLNEQLNGTLRAVMAERDLAQKTGKEAEKAHKESLSGLEAGFKSELERVQQEAKVESEKLLKKLELLEKNKEELEREVEKGKQDWSTKSQLELSNLESNLRIEHQKVVDELQSALDEDKQKAENQKSVFEEEKSKLKQQSASLEIEVKALQSNHEETEKILTNVQNALKKSESQVKTSLTNIKELEAKLVKSEAASAESLSRLRAQLAVWQGGALSPQEIETRTLVERGELKLRVSQLEAQIKDLETQLGRNRSEIEQTRKSAVERSAEFERLKNGVLATRESEKLAAQRIVSELRAELSEVQRALAQANADKASLFNAVKNFESQVGRLQAEKNEIGAAIEKLRRKAAESESKAASFEDRAREAELLGGILRAEVFQLQEQLSEARAKVGQLSADKEMYKEVSEKSGKELSDKLAWLSAAQKKLKELERKYQKAIAAFEKGVEKDVEDERFLLTESQVEKSEKSVSETSKAQSKNKE